MNNEILRNQFNQFKKNHNKIYENQEEEDERFEIFSKNYKFIQEHNNSENKTYTMGVNKFADMNSNEIPKGLNMY